MASDKYQAKRAYAVTPSDTDKVPSVATADGSGNRGNVLFVGSGGDLAVETVGGDQVTFKNINDGSFIPVHVIKVLATGTTASDIIALW